MGAKIKDLVPSFINAPGAGRYSPPSKTFESTGKTFHSKLHQTWFQGELGTGPAGYSPNSTSKGALRYSMRMKLEDIAFKK